MKEKIIKKTVLIIMIFIFTLSPIAFADAGDFETYSSDSRTSSSDSWRSSDSYSSMDSDWSRSWDEEYYENNDYFGNEFNKIKNRFIIVVAVSAFIAAIFSWLKFGNSSKYGENMKKINNNKEIIDRIKQTDPEFNESEFISWVESLFIKLQNAWTDRDVSVIKCYENRELYEKHSAQIQVYIQNKQINKLERARVNSVEFLNFWQGDDKEIISVMVNSTMIDYVIDENTKELIKGNREEYKTNNYKLLFVRKAGIKTTQEFSLNTTICPNCGEYAEIVPSGKCQYCGKDLEATEYNWTLLNMGKFVN